MKIVAIAKSMAGIFKTFANSPKNTTYDNAKGVELDISLITPRIIVSGAPTTSHVNSLIYNDLGLILDELKEKHGNNWRLFNLQGEGCDYTDADFNYQVYHFPFPDHEPPPVKLMLQCIRTIREYLNRSEKNVVMIHCKNGKGRSGTIACAYLMSYEGYSLEAANGLFTTKRMKHFSGDGVSIVSQLRYLEYVKHMVNKPSIQADFWDGPLLKVEFLKIELINWRPNKKNLDVWVYTHLGPGKGSDIVKIYTWKATETSDQIGFSRNLEYKMDYKKMPKFSNKADLRLSIGTFVSASFNIFFESLSSNELTLIWDDFDGHNGTSLKGKQLFDELHISWQIEGLR